MEEFDGRPSAYARHRAEPVREPERPKGNLLGTILCSCSLLLAVFDIFMFYANAAHAQAIVCTLGIIAGVYGAIRAGSPREGWMGIVGAAICACVLVAAMVAVIWAATLAAAVAD